MAGLKIIEPSRELLDGVLETLKLSEHPKKEIIKQYLKAHANAFSMHRSIEGRLPTIHQDAARMRDIAKGCAELLQKIDELHPLIHGGLSRSYADKNSKGTSLATTKSDLVTLKSIAENFGASNFSKKQPDDILRNAVGGLMLLIETFTETRASVQKRSSDLGTPPQLSSPEAKVIGMLLRFGQEDLQDTTLVNVITAIRREGDSYKENYGHQLILGGSVTAF